MNALYKYEQDFGRMGSLNGIFIADKDQVNELQEHFPTKWVYDRVGKHSEVQININEHLEEVTTDKEILRLFEEKDLSVGYNPIDELQDRYEEEKRLENG